jgi:RHS repeat-associated protein
VLCASTVISCSRGGDFLYHLARTKRQTLRRGHSIQETHGSTVNDLFYSADWQVLEERTGGVSTATVQYVWSPVYVDALILRDRSTQNNGTLDERLWVQQDANWNVTALVNSSGQVVERYIYDPYGQVTYLNASFGTISGSAYAWIYGFQDLRLDTATGNNHADGRDYRPTMQRWVEQDPMGLQPDVNPYRFVGNDPTNMTDPSGFADPAQEYQKAIDAANKQFEDARKRHTAPDLKDWDKYKSAYVFQRDQNIMAAMEAYLQAINKNAGNPAGGKGGAGSAPAGRPAPSAPGNTGIGKTDPSIVAPDSVLGKYGRRGPRGPNTLIAEEIIKAAKSPQWKIVTILLGLVPAGGPLADTLYAMTLLDEALTGQDEQGMELTAAMMGRPRGQGMRNKGLDKLNELGLKDVKLGGKSYDSGRKSLEGAGFLLDRTTATGRKVFRNPKTGAEVYFDSGNALAPGQKPHWHIKDKAGQSFDRGGRPVGSDDGAAHIPAD